MKSTNLQVLGNGDSLQFETATLQVKVQPAMKSMGSRRYTYEVRDFGRKGRAHVWGAANPSFDHPAYTERGKFPQVDKDWDRYNREVVKLMKAPLMEALAVLGLSNEKVGFSRYAGCSCPCSPGFVFNNSQALQGFDVFVTVKRPVKGLLGPATSVNLSDFDEVVFPDVA